MIPTKDQFLLAISKTERLVPAPGTLARAMRLLRSTESSLSEIAELISRDSALVIDVLRCANSVYYGGGRRIAAIDEAIQLIGFRETIRMLNVAVAHQSTNRSLGSYGIAAEDFWAESLFSGLFLEGLAKHTAACDPSEAYTAGLLRFIGRLAINQAIQDLGGGLFWDGRQSIASWEMENVGISQAGAGAHLLRKWEFSDAVVQAVGTQDDREAVASAEPLVHAAHFAARVLPSGINRSFIDSLEHGYLECPPDHPFVVAHHVTSATIDVVRMESYQALLSIRDGMAVA
jgi:HD-like signal output (HDOD) protein